MSVKKTTKSAALPVTMRALQAQAFSLDGLQLVQRPVPQPRRGEILLRIRAASLNYRDLAVLTQNYYPTLATPFVPGSDACGEVVELGEGVDRWKIGDRVTPTYTQGWHDGLPTPEMRAKRTLGAPLEGVLQDYLVVPSEDVVAAPAGLTDAEASTLPIAGLTAWNALSEGGLKVGDTVLVQGTGGVALFALQFAKAAGATVIITSSSDEKLARAKALGADIGINYRTSADWPQAVKHVTGGRGVDIVVETGGSTLPQSLATVAFGGFVAVVGFVAGYEAKIGIRQLLAPMARVQGIAVGSRARFERMNHAIQIHGIKPILDRVFPLEHGAAAFNYLEGGAGHFGKVVVAL
ncbi:NAD(P)-dependent alcohol dehydrogenase [Variovorax paradoxus]|uniref:zinc-dependent alcohol dehydrogenase family protein n=1 Tax=Variovorax paradoxus TaxID=34073 RepID=UPI00247B2338